MSSTLNSSPSGALTSPRQLETAPETWIVRGKVILQPQGKEFFT